MIEKDRKENYISLAKAAKSSPYSQEYLSLRARQGKLRAEKYKRNWVTTEEWLNNYTRTIGTKLDLEPVTESLLKGGEEIDWDSSFWKTARSVLFVIIIGTLAVRFSPPLIAKASAWLIDIGQKIEEEGESLASPASVFTKFYALFTDLTEKNDQLRQRVIVPVSVGARKGLGIALKEVGHSIQAIGGGGEHLEAGALSAWRTFEEKIIDFERVAMEAIKMVISPIKESDSGRLSLDQLLQKISQVELQVQETQDRLKQYKVGDLVQFDSNFPDEVSKDDKKTAVSGHSSAVSRETIKETIIREVQTKEVEVVPLEKLSEINQELLEIRGLAVAARRSIFDEHISLKTAGVNQSMAVVRDFAVGNSVFLGSQSASEDILAVYSQPTFYEQVNLNRGLLVSGNSTFSNNVVISGIATFSGDLNINATSTFAGNILPGADDTYDIGSTTREWRDLYVDGTGYIDTISADNTTTGTLTVTTDLTINRDLIVIGNTTFGDTAADNINFNGLVNTSIIAVNNTKNLGSASTRWATGYFDTLDATNISGTVITGSTSSATWTINSDNLTNNSEISSLAFERGTPVINAVLQWNALGDANRFSGFDNNFVFNFPVSLFSQVSDGNTSFTSGSLFNYGQPSTHPITQSGAFVGLDIDFSSNITNAAQNQTGVLITLKDGSASGTAIGFDLDGTADFGVDLSDSTISSSDIRLSNLEVISNLIDSEIAFSDGTNSLIFDLNTSGGATVTSGTNQNIIINANGVGKLVINDEFNLTSKLDLDNVIDLDNSTNAIAVDISQTGNADALSVSQSTSNEAGVFSKSITNGNSSGNVVTISNAATVSDASTYTKTGTVLAVSNSQVQTSGTITDSATVLTVTQSGDSGEAMVITNSGTGLSLKVEDEVSDSTPFAIDASGQVGIGISTPSVALHIVGQCVTGDTKLRRRRRIKGKNGEWIEDEEEIPIKDIKPNDEILTLNKTTGKLVWSKVNALMDMGVKPIYTLTTASGKTIRTTGNHPYLVLSNDNVNNQKVSIFVDAANFEIALKYIQGHVEYSDVLKAFTTHKKPLLRYYKVHYGTKKQNAFFTYLKNQLGVALVTKLVKKIKATGKNKANFDVEIAVDAVMLKDMYDVAVLFSGDSDFVYLVKKLQEQGKKIMVSAPWRATARELREAADVYISLLNMPFVQIKKGPSNMYGAHRNRFSPALSMLSQALPYVKGGMWTKVSELAEGQMIATMGDNGKPMYERIMKIEQTSPEHVYDIEVENTHNFVGNGIIAHNTYINSAATTGVALDIDANSLTTGTGLDISSTATAFNGELLTLSKTGASGSTAFTSDIGNITYSQTFNGGVGLDSTGNVLDISRALTLDNTGNTHTISGALMTISDTGTQTAGTLTWTGDTVRIAQNYANTNAAALNITTASTDAGTSNFALRVNDDGTFTDSTPFVVDEAGNVGIGTTGPGQQLEITKSFGLPNTTDSTTGIIFKGTNRFIHNYGTNNFFAGVNAGNFTLTGNVGGNVAVGGDSLKSNTTGYANVAVGYGAIELNTSGTHNIALGASLQKNTTGSRNVALGADSLDENITGSDNTAVGFDSLVKTTGSSNVGVGSDVLWFSIAASNNTAIGYRAGFNNQSTGGNVFIGYQAGYDELGANKLYIENSNSASPLIYGDFASDILTVNGNLGIADTTPDYLLELSSAVGSDSTFALSDGDVAHGLTTLAQTDIWTHLAPISATVGGGRLTMLTDADGQAMELRGVIGSTNPTDATPAVKIIGGISNGTTGIADLGALETVFQVANNDDAAALTVLGSGNVGVGIVSPTATLHVVGQCVTGDTRLRRKRRRKGKNGEWIEDWEDVPIKDIKPNDEILTLNEATGKLVFSKVKALMDMGVKPIYTLTTASGKTIRTTGNHPYLRLPKDIVKQYRPKNTYAFIDASNIIYRNTDKDPWKIDVKKLLRYLRERFGTSRVLYYAGIDDKNKSQRGLYQKMQEWGYEMRLNKVKSFVNEKGEWYTKADVDSRMTFDMMRYLNRYERAVVLTGDGDFYWALRYLINNKERVWLVASPYKTAKELKQLVASDFANLDNLRDHLEFSVSNKKEADSTNDSASGITSIVYTNEIKFVKGGLWTNVSELKEGDYIAVSKNDKTIYEEIESIDQTSPEQVFDIEVEGTHNFVGNGIIAHNTYINSAATTGVALDIDANSLTTGTGLDISSTATAFNGELLTLTKTGASGSTAFTSDIANLTYSHTFNGGVGLDSTGNVLDISRALTLDNTGNTHTVSGALMTISDTGTQTAGTLTWTGDTVRIAQNYANTNAAALNITTASTDAGTSNFALRVNDDGTFTDSTPFVVDETGNVGIGTTGPAEILELTTADGTNNILRFDIGTTFKGGIGIVQNAGALVTSSVDNDFGIRSENNILFGTGGSGTQRMIITTAGNVGIGDTSPDYLLELSSAVGSDSTFALSDGDVAHGLTTLAQTDIWTHLAPISATVGGGRLTMLTDADGQAMELRGVIGSTNPTDTTPAVKIIGGISNGTTGIADLGALETVFQVANNDDAAALTVLGSGNVGVGIVSPTATLHVVGQCVTGDTLLRRRKRRKGKNGEWIEDEEEVPIKDIKPNDEILTLNETTGKLVFSKVNALMDMGVKQTYLLVTQFGKHIRTTAEHPYFVRDPRFVIPEVVSKKVVGSFEVDLSGHIEDLTTKTYISIANRSIFFNIEINKKLKKKLFACFKEKRHLKFFGPRVFAYAIVKLLKSQNILPGSIKIDLEYPGHLEKIEEVLKKFDKEMIISFGSIGKRSPAHFAANGAFNGRLPVVEKLTEEYIEEIKNDRDSERNQGAARGQDRAKSTELTQSQIARGHYQAKLYSQVFDLSSGQWIKVSKLKVGLEVVTKDGWEKIVSITPVAQEHVYDIEVENTHNFVGNDIIAHNTYINSAATTGVALDVDANSLTTGTGLDISSTATAFNGELLTLSKTGASGSTAFTSDIGNITYSQTFNGGVGLDSTGNVLDISRALTLDNTGNTHTISGALMTISDTGTQTAGTLTWTGDTVRIAQNYANTNAAALNITTASTDAGTSNFPLRVNDDGTFTDSTPFVVDEAGNVGIGTTAPAVDLHVKGVSGGDEIVARFDTQNDSAAWIELVGYTGVTPKAAQIRTSTPGALGFLTAQTPGTPGTTIAMLIDTTSNVGIGTTSPTNILSLGGNSARIFWMERHTTANTAGNNLTVEAGGATSAATDKAGGDLILKSGLATGTGTSKITFQTHPAGSTGTVDTTATTAMTILGSGNVGIGQTNPTATLHVVGQCVTGDTKLRRKRRRKGKNGEWIEEEEEIPIKDIKANDEIMTLDETTGKLVWNKVKALMDMGVKPIYTLTTTSGKTIRTTGNHPYFVRQPRIDTNIFNNTFFALIEATAKKFYFEVLAKQKVQAPALDNAIINISRQGWAHLGVDKPKRSKLNLISRYFALPKIVSILASDEAKVNYRKEKDVEFWAFDGIMDNTKIKVVVRSIRGGTKHFYSVLWQGEQKNQPDDELISFAEEVLSEDEENKKGAVSRLYPRRRGLVTPQLQKEYNIFVKSLSSFIHSEACERLKEYAIKINNNELFNPKDGEWRKVMELSEGLEIAVADKDRAVWDTIVKIDQTSPEHVYDIEVAGTHNFVGNDIIAHNTYINSAATTGVALDVDANSLTTGTGLDISSTATAFNGELLILNKTGASGSTAFTSDIANITYSQTFNGGVGLDSTGNVLDISRALTLDNTGNTHTISGALMTISDTGTQTNGTLTWTGDTVRIAQNYANTNAAALNITTASTDAGTSNFALRVNDDGTFTDSTPFVVDEAGNVGIGTTGPLAPVHIGAAPTGYTAPSQLPTLMVVDNTANQGSSIILWDNQQSADLRGLRINSNFILSGDFGIQSLNDAGTVKGTRFYINSDGNVGIGDTGPDSLLNIQATGAADNGIIIEQTNAGDYDPVVQFQLADGTTNFTLGVDDSVAGDPFKISTTGLGTGDTLVVDPRTTTSGVSALTFSTGTAPTIASAATAYFNSSTFTPGTVNFSGSTQITSTGTSANNALLFNQPTINRTDAASNLTIDQASNMFINGPTIASHATVGQTETITASSALRIGAGSTVAGTRGVVTNAYGLYVDVPTGATNNYAATFAGGNVGIGTTTPGTPLEVYTAGTAGTVTNVLKLTSGLLGGDSVNAGVGIRFSQNGAGESTKAEIHFKEQGGSNGSAILFRTGDNVTGTLQDRVIINNTGNLGIGDTGPDSLLNIQATGAADNGIIIEQTNAGDYDPLVQFQLADGTTNFTLGVDDSVAGDPFKISTTGLGTGDTLVIDPRTTTSGVSALTFATGTAPTIASAATAYFNSSTFTPGTVNFSGSTQITSTGTSANNALLFNQPTINRTDAASNLTIDQASTLFINGPTIASHATVGQTETITASSALRIGAGSTVAGTRGVVTNAYGLYVDAPTGATNNYAATFAGGNVGIGTTGPDGHLTISTSDILDTIGIKRTDNGDNGIVKFYTGVTEDWILGQRNTTDSDFHLYNYGTSADAITVLRSSGNVGIGTTSPTNLLSLGGNSARTFWMERHTTANTAGNNLTVEAGGATSAATDKAGGDLVLKSGLATGTGTSKITFQTHPAGSTGTVDTTATTAMTILGSGNVGIGDADPTRGKLVVAQTDAANLEAIYIDTEESTATQNVFSIQSDVTSADTLKFKITADGSTYSDINTTDFSGAADVAEMYPKAEEVEPGDIVELTDAPADYGYEETFAARKAYKNSNKPLFGVISTSPAQVLGYEWKRMEKVAKMTPVALVGKVPVKVSEEGGAIQRGDYITVSSIPGVGMKAGDEDSTIGIALEPYQGEEDNKILVFVNLGERKLTVKESDNGQIVLGASSIPLLLANLTITPEGTIQINSLATKELSVEYGITLYDKVNKQPYCVYMEEGVLTSKPGKCVWQEWEKASVPEPAPEPELGAELEPEPVLSPEIDNASSSLGSL